MTWNRAMKCVVEEGDHIAVYADRDRQMRRLNLESGLIVVGISFSYAPLWRTGLDVRLVLAAVCIIATLAVISHLQKREEILRRHTPMVTLVPQGIQVEMVDGRMVRIRWTDIRGLRPHRGPYARVEIETCASPLPDGDSWSNAHRVVAPGRPVVSAVDLPISPDALILLIEKYAAGPHGPAAGETGVWPPRPKANT